MNIDHKDTHDAEVQSYFTSMKKSSSFQFRVEVANILGKMYQKNYQYSDGIFTRIYRFISDSNDKQQRKIGLIVLAQLAIKMQGSSRSAFVNKFHSPVFKLFENNTDQNLIELIQEAYGVILQIGGNKNDSVVQSDLTNSLLLLRSNTKDVRKMGAYSAIRLLVNNSPYLTFKKLLQKHNQDTDNLTIMLNASKSKNIKVRESYLKFLSDYMEYASQKKDISYQQHTMHRFLQPDFFSQINNNSEQTIHLHIETLTILLEFMKNIFTKNKLKQSTKYMLEKISTNKSIIIQQSLIKLVPHIFDATQWSQNMLTQILGFLRTIKGKDQVLAQRAINKLLNIYKIKQQVINLNIQKILKPLLNDISQSLKILSSKPLTKLSNKPNTTTIVNSNISSTSSKRNKNNNTQLIIFWEQYLIKEKVQTLLTILLAFFSNQQTQSKRKISKINKKSTFTDFKRSNVSNVSSISDSNNIGNLSSKKYMAESLLTYQQLNSLASSCLLLSLTKKTLKLINQISKRNIHNLGVHLETKLMILISKILTGSGKRVISSKDLNQELKQFLEKMDKVITDSDENKVRAIQALSLFKFREGIKDFVGGFVKEKVLKNYLQWGNGLMRCAAVQAAFNLYTKKNNAIAENQMMQILDRLIRVGMTDSQYPVRYKVFSQLYANIQKLDNFYRFILHPQLLIHLFQTTQDSNQQLRLLSLQCLTCLYKKHPSPQIIPFLKKFLYNILYSLQQVNFKYYPQKSYLITSLSMLIEEVPSIIQNHIQMLLENILGYLQDRKNYQGLEIVFFRAFQVIIRQHPHKAVLYIQQICKNIVYALADKLDIRKRSHALKLLNTLVQSCGYVVIPYFQVPQLLNSLIYLLKSQISNQSRINIIRIIGGFGAIDQQKFHKIQTILSQYNTTHNYQLIIQKGFKFNFLKWRQQLEMQKNNDNHQQQLKKYYDQMMILEGRPNKILKYYQNQSNIANNNIQNGNTLLFEQNNNTGTSNDGIMSILMSTYKFGQKLQNNIISKNKKIQKDKNIIQVTTATQQNLTNKNKNINQQIYQQISSLQNFNLYIIKCLISIIKDTFLTQKIQLSLDVLSQIFELLNTQLQQHLSLIFPMLLSLQIQQQCIQLIIVLAKDCNISSHLDQIIDFSLRCNCSFQILTDFLELISYKYSRKSALQTSIPAIIRKLYTISSQDQNRNIKLQVKILIIYHNLKQSLQPHLPQIIPILLQRYLLANNNHKNNQTTRACIQLILSLTNTCRSMVQYLSEVVDKFVRILLLCRSYSGGFSIQKGNTTPNTQSQTCIHVNCRPCLRSKIGNCFVLFLINFQNQFMVYLPIVHQAMIIQKHQLYEKAIHYMQNCYYGNIRDQFTQQQLDKIIISDVRVPLLNKYQIPKYAKKMQGTQQLVHEFDVIGKKYIEQDWIQWLKKISVLMIKKSPNIILRTCSDLAEGYTELSLQLFNISFFWLWEILSDNQKKQLLDHLKCILLLQSQSAHILIRKTLLNLFQFMMRKKCPLQIPNKIISRCAQQSSAYAKTLYYKQLQFQSDSCSNLEKQRIISELIETYMKLGQPQNAYGLLKIAENVGIDCQLAWYQKLSKYQKAYQLYSQKLEYWEENNTNNANNNNSNSNSNSNNDNENSRTKQIINLYPEYKELFVKKLKCLKYIDQQKFLDQLQDNSKQLFGNPQLSVIACHCYAGLEQWQKIQQWHQFIPAKQQQQKTFYQAVLAILNLNLQSALNHIQTNRKIIYNQIQELIAFSSSTTSFSKIIKAQKLCQLEEIIQIKKIQEKLRNCQNLVNANSGAKSVIGEEIWDGIANRKGSSFNYQIENGTANQSEYYISLDNQYKKRTTKIKNRWSDRLQGCPRQQSIWSKFVSIRSLLFDKLQYFQFYYQYCEICIANNKVNKCQKILHQFKRQFELQKQNDTILPKSTKKQLDLIELLQIQVNFVQNIITNQEQIQNILVFLRSKSNHVILPAKKSQIYWRCIKKLEEIYQSTTYQKDKNGYKKNVKKVMELYEQSTKNYAAQSQLQQLAKIYLKYLDISQNPTTNIIMALKAYLKILKTCQSDNQHFLQSCLKIFSILLKYSNQSNQVYQQFLKTYSEVPIYVWTNVIPQMIAHLHQQPLVGSQNINGTSNFTKIIKQLLLKTGLRYPETVLYCLNFSLRSKIPERIKPAQQILSIIKQHHYQLCDEISIISGQLSNAAIKLKQYWYDSIEGAWGIYSQNKNAKQVITLLKDLKQQIYSRCSTNSQLAFHQQYGQDIREGYYWLQKYQDSNQKNMLFLSQAFQIFIQIYLKIKQSFDNLKKIYLINVAPNLIASRKYCSSIPGMYQHKGDSVQISSFQNQLIVLQSKQRPRKLTVFGSDGKQYNFLLKGRQDIRLDERVMQFFGLVNKLLEKQRQSLKHNLKIERYSIIPLTVNTGLIGWVQNCDTLNQLIKQYRADSKIRLFVERQIYQKISPQYAYLPLMNKLEIFLSAQQSTQGKDLQNVFWNNSSSAEQWVEKRHAYTTSLATMSIVGYILGLGDRHPSNIMINKQTGKIVHIDFGDCFEVAMLRQKFPQKIPFRLTRMLKNVMGTVSIYGLYKHTCENVMRVLRTNKQSLLSVLQTFVHDPILSWRIIIDKKPTIANQDEQKLLVIAEQKQKIIQPIISKLQNFNKIQNQIMGSIMSALGDAIQNRNQDNNNDNNKQENHKNGGNPGKPGIIGSQNIYHKSIYPQKINEKAINALIRIEKKLSGLDWNQTSKQQKKINQMQQKDQIDNKQVQFIKNNEMTPEQQVQRLIFEAMSHENICQSWPGWCPYW